MKVTVVGAGNVGATAAECIARKDMVDEVVLIDIVDGFNNRIFNVLYRFDKANSTYDIL